MDDVGLTGHLSNNANTLPKSHKNKVPFGAISCKDGFRRAMGSYAGTCPGGSTGMLADSLPIQTPLILPAATGGKEGLTTEAWHLPFCAKGNQSINLLIPKS